MKRMITLFTVLTLAVLTACTTVDYTSSGTIPEANTIANNAEDGFTAIIEGFITEDIATTGEFTCESEARGEDVLVLSAWQEAEINNVIFTLPTSITAGEYDLTDDGDVMVLYYGDNLITEEFSQNVSGTLELVEIAAEVGAPIIGNFEFTAENADGEVVTVAGEFDFRADRAAFAECAS
ncbi:MAG: hypothetical protein AAFR81_10920 [Chloroflexota bacterium]